MADAHGGTSAVAEKAADHAHAGGHGHGDHPDFLAHHFDTPQQQFDAGKLGIWLFLVTEVLFFSGLFCAYAIYRANHPEIFVYAHRFLDTKLGAINTGVLLFSSLTMAWAVRCAQLNQRKGLIVNLAITILCGFGFMGIKAVEYHHKWHEGLLWGKHYQPSEHALAAAEGGHAAPPAQGAAPAAHGSGGSHAAPASASAAPAEAAPAPAPTATRKRPANVHIFFGIYFCMTGLHGIHVLVGMGLLAWLLLRAIRGEFHELYFGPVDYVGLYWHIVDLVWIYLFPLLYLIH